MAGRGKSAGIGAGGGGAGGLTQILMKGGAIRVPLKTVLTFSLDKLLRLLPWNEFPKFSSTPRSARSGSDYRRTRGKGHTAGWMLPCRSCQ
jgi:hypothetical protein